MTTYQNIPVEDLPFLYVNGLIVSNNATTPNTKVDVSSGQCRDTNDIMDLSLSASVTIDTAVVGAVNGLDQGTFAASKVYAVYIIGSSQGKAVTGALLSLASNSAPLMPYLYDSYRLVGYAVSDGSTHFLKAYIAGNNNYRKFVYDAPQATAVTAGNSATYAGVVLTTLVAPVNLTPVDIFVNWTANAAADVFNMQTYGGTGDQITAIAPVAGATAHTTLDPNVLASLNSAAPTVNYKVSAGTVAINVKGFSFFI